MKTVLLYILLITAFFSCDNEQKEKEKQILQLVNEWQGKQIVFPENAIFTRYLTDTTDYQIPQSEYKVLIYVDSIGCTSCKLQLHKWKELIEYTNSVTQNKVPFLFFFHPKDAKEIRYLLKRDGFDRPICIDLDDRLNKLNKFPADMTFQTFLLDKNNKIAVLGNPVHNTAVKDLYLKQITGKDSPNKNIPKTTAEVNQTEIDFGTFDKSEIKQTTIEVKNTGDSPLVIVDISTTCGCTAATYDKRPAKPEETLRVGIKMTPKDTGFFDEVVTIKYNSINNRPVKVRIKGYAK
ncbi:hypothetical protein CE91St1_10310 [Parabacteroides goldsteinii]|uniref:DUF1573 domain-containing protein n=1 Tax=Parabacteroides goldsteinii TaxID=328812 RepID=UPI001FBBE133|nr:DUF1573 domain-containing protein [Parabacteroides goldsteinii]GKG71888.1 hypothetical protein CE91St1_10310 [Parabacteroides goldsteinii]GKG77823.1 hypothetical protein CE91St2_10150 [Parabacteroides goldsteinii]